MEKLLENRQKKTGSRIINGNPYFCCVLRILIEQNKKKQKHQIKIQPLSQYRREGHTIQIGM